MRTGHVVPARMRQLFAANFVVLLLLTCAPIKAAEQSAPAVATPSTGLILDGKVKHPQRVNVDLLRSLPAEHVDVSFQAAHGTEKSSYTGVLLWALLAEAGGIDDPEKGAELRHTINITGRDGYSVVISTGEIAPDFGAKPAVVAYQRNGQELGDNGLRVVMPGDRHGGRYVRDVVEIEVK